MRTRTSRAGKEHVLLGVWIDRSIYDGRISAHWQSIS